MLNDALAYLKAGLSVIPTDRTTKKPFGGLLWEPYQRVLPTSDQVESWFKNGAALAVIAGPVSGNLEFIDFDEPGLAKEWRDLLASWNCADLVKRLVIENSPRGGCHIAYRHQGPPEGNQKLAWTSDKKARIETRGQGGYCLTYPSEGYKLKAGKYTELPLITAEEREALLSACRTFDEAPVEYTTRSSGRVGDDYNARASISEILTPLNWTAHGREGWVRPGKSPRMGISGTWDHKGNRHFCLFSSNAGLEPGNYDLFGLYARLHHGADFTAAAIAAGRAGYGETRQQTLKRMTADIPEVDNANRKWFTFDQIEEEEINWILEPYLPIGIGYTLVFGDSGIGKTTSVLAILADLSRGIHPFTKEAVEPLRSIILSAEDSAKHVIKPRLKALGANMKLIMAPEEHLEDGTPNPLRLDAEGAEALRAQVKAFNARLVMIDPLTAYFDGESMNDRLQARTWARRIHEMSVQENCAPIVVHHVNKASGMQGRYRASGSQDFFDGSRSALMAVRAGSDSDDYALVHEKHNLSPQGEALGYTFNRETGFEWTGISDLTSEAAAAAVAEQHVGPKELNRCKAWILEQLENGKVLSNDLRKGADAEGMTRATYNRARAELKDQIKSYQVEKGVKDSPFWTELRSYQWNEEKDPYE